jgi:hypothetical protein
VKFIEGRAGIRNCARRLPFIEPFTQQQKWEKFKWQVENNNIALDRLISLINYCSRQFYGPGVVWER